MATSGTFTFQPEYADLVTESWERIGKGRDSMPGDLARSARMSLNLMFTGEWANSGVKLWAIDLQTQVLTPGDFDYAAPVGTIAILDAWITRASSSTDQLITGLSRSEYASLANKLSQSTPTQFYFDRQIAPVINLWPVPAAADTLKYYRLRRMQTVTAVAETPDAPDLWFDAICAGLAVRFAEKWAPERLEEKQRLAVTALALAMGENRERVPTKIRPQFDAYRVR
jgi:hypothetical protein